MDDKDDDTITTKTTFITDYKDDIHNETSFIMNDKDDNDVTTKMTS